MTTSPDRDDLMARVRRADPSARLPQMTPRPVDHLLDQLRADEARRAAQAAPEIGADSRSTPRRATRGRRPRRPRRLVAGFAAAALTGAAALAVVALPIGDRAHLDVVAEARAQLSLTGGILHTVVLQTTDPPLPETYVLSDGVRHTIDHTTIRVERWAEPTTGDFHQRSMVVEIGPETIGEQSWVDGRFVSTHDGKLQSSTVDREQANVLRRVGMLSGFPSISTTQPDPIIALRGMLADGSVRAAGEQTSGGRRVIRLVPTAQPPSAGGGLDWSRPAEYLVDASTFAPVQVTFVQGAKVRTRAGTTIRLHPITTTMRFVKVERLPITPANRRLLSIDPAGREVIDKPHLFRDPTPRTKPRRVAPAPSP